MSSFTVFPSIPEFNRQGIVAVVKNSIVAGIQVFVPNNKIIHCRL